MTDPSVPKKTKGKQKIKIEFIEQKQRRQITFYKRKAGLFKKAHELQCLTGTNILLLMASETGHVYTYATPDLQPMITTNQALIKTCLGQTLEHPTQFTHITGSDLTLSSDFQTLEKVYPNQSTSTQSDPIGLTSEKEYPEAPMMNLPPFRTLLTGYIPEPQFDYRTMRSNKF